jgi:hypothetical protein
MNKGIAQDVAVVWQPQVTLEGVPLLGPESRSRAFPGLGQHMRTFGGYCGLTCGAAV